MSASTSDVDQRSGRLRDALEEQRRARHLADLMVGEYGEDRETWMALGSTRRILRAMDAYGSEPESASKQT